VPEKQIPKPMKLAARIAREHHGGLEKGTRHVELSKIAGRLKWEGLDVGTIKSTLHELNDSYTNPPMPRQDIERLVKWIATKPSGGGGAGAQTRENFQRCRSRVIELQRMAHSMPWRGRSASTDFSVLAALHEIAAGCGRLELTASYRQLTLTSAAKSPRTIGKAFRRLQRHGWLNFQPGGYDVDTVTKNVTTRTTLVRLRAPRRRFVSKVNSNAASPPSLTVQVRDKRSQSTPRPDHWRGSPGRGGMNETTRRLWKLLTAERGAKVGELSELSGMGRATIYSHLAMLERRGYARRLARGTWARTDADPDANPTYSVAAELKRRHEIDRENFQDQQLPVLRKLCAPKRARFADGAVCDTATGEVIELNAQIECEQTSDALRRDWEHRTPIVRLLTMIPGDPATQRLVAWLAAIRVVSTTEKLAA